MGGGKYRSDSLSRLQRGAPSEKLGDGRLLPLFCPLHRARTREVQDAVTQKVASSSLVHPATLTPGPSGGYSFLVTISEEQKRNENPKKRA